MLAETLSTDAPTELLPIVDPTLTGEHDEVKLTPAEIEESSLVLAGLEKFVLGKFLARAQRKIDKLSDPETLATRKEIVQATYWGGLPQPGLEPKTKKEQRLALRTSHRRRALTQEIAERTAFTYGKTDSMGRPLRGEPLISDDKILDTDFRPEYGVHKERKHRWVLVKRKELPPGYEDEVFHFGPTPDPEEAIWVPYKTGKLLENDLGTPVQTERLTTGHYLPKRVKEEQKETHHLHKSEDKITKIENKIAAAENGEDRYGRVLKRKQKRTERLNRRVNKLDLMVEEGRQKRQDRIRSAKKQAQRVGDFIYYDFPNRYPMAAPPNSYLEPFDEDTAPIIEPVVGPEPTPLYHESQPTTMSPGEQLARYIAGEYRTDEPNVPFGTMSLKLMEQAFRDLGFSEEGVKRMAAFTYKAFQEQGVISTKDKVNTKRLGEFLSLFESRREERDEWETIKKNTKKTIENIDNLERNLAWASPEESVSIRVEINNLLQNLSKMGVYQINTKAGDPFDWDIHEAMDYEGEGDEQVVSKILNSGYGFRDLVLRPVNVIVRNQPSKAAETAPEVAVDDELDEPVHLRGTRAGKAKHPKINRRLRRKSGEANFDKILPFGEDIERAVSEYVYANTSPGNFPNKDQIEAVRKANIELQLANYFGVTLEQLRQGKVPYKNQEKVREILSKPYYEIQQLAKEQPGRRRRKS